MLLVDDETRQGALRFSSRRPFDDGVIAPIVGVMHSSSWKPFRIRSTKSMVDERSEADIAYFASFAA